MTHVPCRELPDSLSPTQEEGELVVHFRYTNLATTQVFFAIWLSLWAAACLLLFNQGFWSGSLSQRLLVMLFVTAWFLGLYAVLYLSLVHRTFRFRPDSLLRETRLFGVASERDFDRASIQEVLMTRPRKDRVIGQRGWSVELDTGRRGASWPRRDLFLRSNRVLLQSGLTSVESGWLGATVAHWSNVSLKRHIWGNEKTDEDLSMYPGTSSTSDRGQGPDDRLPQP